MISRAIVQSAIVLMNRRMKAERGEITFVPVCSSVAGMPLHHLGGCHAMQERSEHFDQRGCACSWESHNKSYADIAPSFPKSIGNAPRTYCGVDDGVGETASVASDGIGAVASTAGDGFGRTAAGAGSTAVLNICDLRCLWFCNCSVARWVSARRSCVNLSFSAFSAFIREGSAILARI